MWLTCAGTRGLPGLTVAGRKGGSWWSGRESTLETACSRGSGVETSGSRGPESGGRQSEGPARRRRQERQHYQTPAAASAEWGIGLVTLLIGS